GNLKHTIHDHEVTMDSSTFVELDEQLIPTGKKLDVSDTSFDFRKGRPLAEGIASESEQNRIAGGGYDHYFIFDQQRNENIIVTVPDSRRRVTIETDQSVVVMYIADGLDDELALEERPSEKHLGVCFETQGSPASLHHDDFPSIVLEAGTPYKKRTAFTFD